jgi:hypothetical protein
VVLMLFVRVSSLLARTETERRRRFSGGCGVVEQSVRNFTKRRPGKPTISIVGGVKLLFLSSIPQKDGHRQKRKEPPEGDSNSLGSCFSREKHQAADGVSVAASKSSVPSPL